MKNREREGKKEEILQGNRNKGREGKGCIRAREGEERSLKRLPHFPVISNNNRMLH
jgi:hypothetical protein